MPVEFIALCGFLLAAYSIVANDAIQTLGTFLSSNEHRPWWVLWLFASLVLVSVLVFGWISNGGDAAYGRLDHLPVLQGGITWIHVVPPLAILILTRYGIPVSTTFLVLTVFAPKEMLDMLSKSGLGYVVAFVLGLVIYKTVMSGFEKYFADSALERPAGYWVAIQWGSTAFLWSQWLIQDMANIFVYLPRDLSVELLFFAIVVLLLLHAVIFYNFGGAIQKIVTSKSNTRDIRSASVIDILYGLILLVFKEYSDIPMSTTWVFLGLLAGRELAFSLNYKMQSLRQTGVLVAKDAAKATAGLTVSIALAICLPWINDLINPQSTASAPVRPALAMQGISSLKRVRYHPDPVSWN